MAMLFSAAVHGFILFNLVVPGLIALAFPGHAPRPRPTAVGMLQLPPSQWTGNRSVGAEGKQTSQAIADAKATEPQKPEEKKEAAKPPGQVVDIASNGLLPPEDARFAAERNNRVAKESYSNKATPFYRNAMPRPTTNVPTEGPKGEGSAQRIGGNDGLAADDRPFKPKSVKTRFEIPDVLARDRLALRFDPMGTGRSREASDAVRGNSKRLLIQPGSGEEGAAGDADGSLGAKGRGDLTTLVPSDATLDKITGAPAADVTPLDGVEKGAETFLNAREWKHASFFNRVKQNVGMAWDPSTALGRRDPSGQVYAYRDRYTVVSVVLDPNGSLKDIFVEKSCGVDFLDEEAIAAFQRAQPFRNPPLALVDPRRNEIHFSFGFYLEVSSRPALRIFRQGN